VTRRQFLVALRRAKRMHPTCEYHASEYKLDREGTFTAAAAVIARDHVLRQSYIKQVDAWPDWPVLGFSLLLDEVSSFLERLRDGRWMDGDTAPPLAQLRTGDFGWLPIRDCEFAGVGP
jgi:hypothetical protein